VGNLVQVWWKTFGFPLLQIRVSAQISSGVVAGARQTPGHNWGLAHSPGVMFLANRKSFVSVE
jgi:hypothetical protein